MLPYSLIASEIKGWHPRQTKHQPGAQLITKGDKAMQKKSSKKKPPAKSLLARAKAIINSDNYDDDTRESIKFELDTNYSGLADMVERAEQGETICDTLRLERDYRKAAHQVIALCNKSAAPDFLTDAMIEVLDEASKIKGIQIFSD
jgi:hypothetical protein